VVLVGPFILASSAESFDGVVVGVFIDWKTLQSVVDNGVGVCLSLGSSDSRLFIEFSWSSLDSWLSSVSLA